MFNLSFQTGIIPHQWKIANIVPIPKIPNPSSLTDFRPISLTPIISRLLERTVVKTNLYPLFFNPTLAPLFSDQYAFRPFGSTDAAIISIIHHITSLLSDNSYVRLIALDFSKAFDTVKHSCILSKLSALSISDQLFNWLVNYFQGHSHTTRFNNATSSTAEVNASVFQGSAIGPSLFVMNGIDLKPVYKANYIGKYADDSYLITSSKSEHTVEDELKSIEQWALRNNLSLNKSKSVDVIIYPSDRAKKHAPIVRPLTNIKRDSSIKILGVTFNDNLSLSRHVSEVTHSAAQALYALKLLKAHGLDQTSLELVCKATLISRLTYAAPSWRGYASAEDKLSLQSVINRARRWGLYGRAAPNLVDICCKRELDLFSKIISNPYHVLYPLLPPVTAHSHNLRERAHQRQLPIRGGGLQSKSFMQRMLFKDMY